MPTRNRHSYSATHLRTTHGNVSGPSGFPTGYIRIRTGQPAAFPLTVFAAFPHADDAFGPSRTTEAGGVRPIRSKKRRRPCGPCVGYTHSENRTTDSAAAPGRLRIRHGSLPLSRAAYVSEKVRFAERHAPRPTAPHKTSPERTGPTFGRTVPSGLVSNTTVPLRHPRRSGGFIGGPSACGAAGRPHQMERIFSVLSNSRLTGFWFLIALLNGM